MNVTVRRSLDVFGTLLLAVFVIAVGATAGAMIAWLLAVFAP